MPIVTCNRRVKRSIDTCFFNQKVQIKMVQQAIAVRIGTFSRLLSRVLYT